jgi:hypothetical protein
MNKVRLRELFAGLKGDVRDYYDAKRDMLDAERRILEGVTDVAAEVLGDDGGVIAEGDGVEVRQPPSGVHTFVDGRCVSHPGCTVIRKQCVKDDCDWLAGDPEKETGLCLDYCVRHCPDANKHPKI